MSTRRSTIRNLHGRLPAGHFANLEEQFSRGINRSSSAIVGLEEERERERERTRLIFRRSRTEDVLDALKYSFLSFLQYIDRIETYLCLL